MKLTTFDIGPMKDRLIGDEKSVTIETRQGRFTIAAQEDGSLVVRESGHKHLALLPQSSNAVALHAISPPHASQATA